jgi:phosphatidylserine/phosphatidylglycerophosphate/cardiolipin synthase-like enzyme
VKLLIQPDDGVAPLIRAIRSARQRVDILIFRFDLRDLENALIAAVPRGVAVRALIAHSNQGGASRLRKLEQRLLAAGVTVARTADDLERYHGKMTIVDDTLYVLGFNYTKLDIEKSRSFGVVTRDARLVKQAQALFEADATRQAFVPGDPRLVVSPETSREALASFIRGAKSQLLIYDDRLTDNRAIKVIRETAERGVEVRLLGKIEKDIEDVDVRKLGTMRLHVRAIVRDGASVFIGSQSLRRLELEKRREIGVLVNDARLARKVKAVFEGDWAATGGGKVEKSKARKVDKRGKTRATPGRKVRSASARGPRTIAAAGGR